MLNQPMSNLQINPGQQKLPSQLANQTAPAQGSLSPNFRNDQNQQFTPRMATSMAPPTAGAASQPHYPGPGAYSQGLQNGKVIAYVLFVHISLFLFVAIAHLKISHYVFTNCQKWNDVICI